RIANELLIDVADYSHVYQGPGVVLIGHEADYYVEDQRGRLGLRYSRKRGAEAPPQDQLRTALAQLFNAAALLEQEKSLGLKFSTRELLIAVNDRLHAPDNATTHQMLSPVINDVTSKIWGAAP